MEAVAGYYDGKSIQFLERVPIRKNQRVIVTVMDEFVEDKVVAGNGVSNNKRAAFERLEAWRKNNEGFFGADFDWKQEVKDGINEKYGVG